MIGDVIKKYRTEAGLTQEEVANRLGVTTPAVNKWEKNNTQPDIGLIAPVARLFGISTDELLGYKEELSAEEIFQWVKWLDGELDKMPYDDVFLSAKRKIEEYPASYQMIWQTAVILDARLSLSESVAKEPYWDVIQGWYEQCLLTDDEELRNHVVGSLFQRCVNQEQYESAEKYIDYLAIGNPERKRMQAVIYSHTGCREEAYKLYEEMLFSGYEYSRMVMSSLYMMYMQDDDHDMARKYDEMLCRVAGVFEMGKYHEVSLGLDLAASEKDAEATETIMRAILANIDNIFDFRKSTLYRHMTFKKAGSDFIEKLRENLIKSFLDEEGFGYMRGNEFWEGLRSSDQ